MTVPEGTIDDVLDWVGDDPARAQEALDQEYAGQNRSTLITKLEVIASREEPEPMTDNTTEPEFVEPTPPAEVEISAADTGVVFSPVVARDPDIEIDDGDDLAAEQRKAEAEGEDYADQPLDAEQVEFLQVASSTRGMIVALNGTSYAMTAQMAVALKHNIDKAVSGLSL